MSSEFVSALNVPALTDLISIRDGLSRRSKEIAHEGFRKMLSLMQALQKEVPEELHDGRGIERGKGQEFAFWRERCPVCIFRLPGIWLGRVF
jgi:hypothetical protein